MLVIQQQGFSSITIEFQRAAIPGNLIWIALGRSSVDAASRCAGNIKGDWTTQLPGEDGFRVDSNFVCRSLLVAAKQSPRSLAEPAELDFDRARQSGCPGCVDLNTAIFKGAEDHRRE